MNPLPATEAFYCHTEEEEEEKKRKKGPGVQELGFTWIG